MRVKSIPSKWLVESGARLDCSPYMAGGLEAKLIVNTARFKKQPLRSLTSGHKGGIYNGPMFRRNYVTSKEYGVPFLTSRTMLRADLSDVDLINKADATSNKLSFLKLKTGTSLISCSGSIGNMAYVRPEMDGMWSCQDIMKVEPDRSKIPPGYLYAFLSSKYGIPQIIAGTYGAIIQHIEPEHIAELSVPRLGPKTEREIHELVEKAAELRSVAAAARANVRRDIEEFLGWNAASLSEQRSRVLSSTLVSSRRLDPHYHSIKSENARRALGRNASGPELSALAESIFEPNRSARNKVDDHAFGIPFISSSQIFKLDQAEEFYIARNTPGLSAFLIGNTDVLIPRSGSLGGVIGRACLPLPKNHGAAGSDHLIRIRCPDVNIAYEIFAILSTTPGYYSALSTAFGSAIPSLDCELLGQLHISKLPKALKERVTTEIASTQEQYQEAVDLDLRAYELLQKAIEG